MVKFERRLAPERGQERVGSFALEDVGEHVGVEWFDVGDVGRRRVES